MSQAKSKEIELKLYVGDSAEHVKAAALALGWVMVGTDDQSDTYYTSAHKDFIATEECLRIRTTRRKSELTWKPPTSAPMRERGQFWKEEVDLNVTGQDETVRILLDRLEFIEYVTVKKHREVFRVDEDSVVALDFVAPLGWFAEIETSGNDGPSGAEKNEKIAAELGIDATARVNVPYRDLVKAGRVYTND